MKKELDYFQVELLFGGGQEWFPAPRMKRGGVQQSPHARAAFILTFIMVQSFIHLRKTDLEEKIILIE